MTDEQSRGLIHSEIDGQLGSEERRELAQRQLADPQTRALLDQLRSVCRHLDGLGQVDPPPQLEREILSRLPQKPAYASPRWSAAHWRLAALVAGVVTAGTLVYQLVEGPGTGSSETVGTMAAGPSVTLDAVTFANGAVSGHASLYREQATLAVALEVSASTGPVDVLITGAGHAFRIKGLQAANGDGVARQTVSRPDVPLQGDIELTLLMDGHAVQHATLHAPALP
ncbi:MAG: hypothetical protein JO299_13435 [Gammaproteobacteria bacterium]|nr:hypothetical protein [Gammaproteobacteria bacterium]